MPIRRFQSSLKQTLIRQDKEVRKELRGEMQAVAQEMADWLTIAVRGWKTVKVRFAARVEIRPDRIVAFADVAGSGKTIFGYIDRGTGKYGPQKKAYKIPKSVTPGKVVKFQTGYKPKTAAVAQINVGPGRATGRWVSAKQVTHPGIQARKFTVTVSNHLKQPFDMRIDQAIRKGLKRVR